MNLLVLTVYKPKLGCSSPARQLIWFIPDSSAQKAYLQAQYSWPVTPLYTFPGHVLPVYVIYVYDILFYVGKVVAGFISLT